MPDAGELVGRAAELGRLVEAASDGPRYILVVGEAGIGKTRLLDEVVAATAPSTSVVRGRADELDTSPFGLWSPVLARLDLPRPGADPSVPHNEQRWDLVDQLDSAIPDGVLLLDDLHWSSDESLWVLEQFVDRARDRPLAIIATSRPEPETRSARWPSLYRRAEVLALGGLDIAGVADLVRSLDGGRVDPQRLRERTGGNPLFVRELLLSGVAAMPSSVEELLTSAIDRLGPETGQVLSLLAVAEPGTPLAVIAFASGVSPAALETHLRVAQRAGVLVHGDEVRFRHDLQAEAAARRLDADGRARAHLALAEAWRSSGEASAAFPLARHGLLAVPAVDATAALVAALDTAAALRREQRHGEAADLLRLAGSVANGRGELDATLAARIAVEESESRWAIDDFHGGTQASERALRLARAAEDPVLQARAEVAAATHHNPFLPDPVRVQRLAVLDDLLADDDTVDPALRVRLTGRRAVVTVTVPDRLDEARALGERAVARARALGDPEVLVGALRDRSFLVASPADMDTRPDAAAEILALAVAARRPALALLGHEWTIEDRICRGDVSGAIGAVDQLTALAAIMPSPSWRYTAAVRRSALLLLLGDYEGALDVAASSRRLANGLVHDVEAIGLELDLRVRAGLLYGRDDHGADEQHRWMVSAVGDLPVLFIQSHLAQADLVVGDHGAARRRLTPWLGRFRSALTGLGGVPVLGAVAHVAARTGWLEPVAELRAELTPFAGRLAGGGLTVDVSIDHHLGALALLERDDSAVPHARTAVDIARRSRSPVLEAQALALLAEAAARAGDHAAANSARDAAEALAEPIGMRLTSQIGRASSAVAPAAPTAPVAPTPPPARDAGVRRVALRRERGRWHLESPSGSAVLADTTGMRQLAQLLAAPGRELSAVDLAEAGTGQPITLSSDLGPALDARAKREYRQRIIDLQADIDEAEHHHDPERATILSLEMDAILAELRAAVGLGGRDRPNGSSAERARVNTARSVRRAIAAVLHVAPDIGTHLEVSIRTGHHCAYRPDPAALLQWEVTR